MGNANSALTEAETRHLMRRAGFGVTPKDLAKLVKRKLTRGQLVDGLLKYKAKPLKASDDMDEVYDRWLETMLKTKTPLLEKLTLFWHDHFATANATVQDSEQMAQQNGLLRTMSKGNFREFLKRINKDPAMMDFLDTVRNRRKTPNENYARELMELFTLGVTDETGAANYAQEDIVQIARAFTGWRLDDKKGVAEFREGSHDYNADFPERGPKVIFKDHGMFGPAGADIASTGEGAIEMDAVIDLLLFHRDSQGQSTVGRRIARRLFEYFASDAPSTALVDELVALSGFAVSWDIAALVRTILVHDAFYATAVPLHAGGTTKSVKWPIDYVVSTLRLLAIKPKRHRYSGLVLEDSDSFRSHLDDMGQRLFDPPSVFGWDWEAAWISSATLLARFRFARDLASARVSGKQGFHPEKLLPITLQSPNDILNAASDVLGIKDQLSPQDRALLLDYLTDGGGLPALNLKDDDIRGRKLHGLFALLLQSPAYQLH